MTLNAFFPLVGLVALAGCTIIPDASAPVRPEGSTVALGQSVSVGPLVATPLEVVEDSRCPMNARCIWAGQAIVTTQFSNGAQSYTADLTLGEPAQVLGQSVRLASIAPEQVTNITLTPADYRFTYELAF